MAFNNIFSRLDKLEKLLPSLSGASDEGSENSDFSLKIENMGEEINKLGQQFAKAVSDIEAKTSKSFKQLEAIVQHIGTKSDQNSKTLGEMQNKMKDVDAKIKELGDKITEVVKKTDELSAKPAAE